ncbi:hypothetical protein BC937DRAFT_92565 [Endogone sp. FLAS-F59071]|nr:hypothetical protein BC937DRAFT_92565 [Endogone sp. FLAS-F59071]|eukprot:RUS15339.1 hypothetical protein BC937DRAFT_92565 [Endogone sp. FLAS-F59071]
MNHGRDYNENVEYLNSSYSSEDFQTYLTVLDQTIPRDIPSNCTYVNPLMLYNAGSLETIPRRGRSSRTSYSQVMALDRPKQDRGAALHTSQPSLLNIPNLRSSALAGPNQSRTATILGTPYCIPSRHTKKRATTSPLTPPTPTDCPTQPTVAAPTQTSQGPISVRGGLPLGPEAKYPSHPGIQLPRPAAQPSLHIVNPSNCQHPKHMIYNPDDLEPFKPRRGRPPRGASAGLPVTIVVPRRLREVLELGAGTRICNTCKRRTDMDEEYLLDPRYKGPE